MPSVCGVRLPKLDKLRKARFPRRLQVMNDTARKVFLKRPKGITVADGLAFVEHFKPLFEKIGLYRSKKTGGLKVKVVTHYCRRCAKEFDLKDWRGTRFGDGKLHCPQCWNVVRE